MPIVSERSLNAQTGNVVVFRVQPSTSKGQVRRAIQEKYGVKVLAIRTANFLPKARRRSTTQGAARYWKKAYVKVNDVGPLNLAP